MPVRAWSRSTTTARPCASGWSSECSRLRRESSVEHRRVVAELVPDQHVRALRRAHDDAAPLAVAPRVARDVADAVLRAQLLGDAVVDAVELGRRVREVHLAARVA